MKGRIYSKFHERKMLELSPTGLYNSATLFLTLANAVDIVDVTNKLSELLALAPLSNLSKAKILYRSYLASLLLLMERGCDILHVAQKLTSVVSSACQEYLASKDAVQRRFVAFVNPSYEYTISGMYSFKS
ncbi:hypothetical protein SK128_027971 [Halocaridina rubra]|uniref:Protein MMS22-like N-terminal domain-containing protein n=1 Tax=Halocaridina rubra TaxID=373956 RepID=A0AAN8WEH7_HALRR